MLHPHLTMNGKKRGVPFYFFESVSSWVINIYRRIYYQIEKQARLLCMDSQDNVNSGNN